MTTTVAVTVAGHQVSVTERQATEGQEGHNVTENAVTLKVTGVTSTFYVHGSNSLVIQELPEAAETAVDQINVAGSARELGPDDFAKVQGEKIGEDDQD